MGPHKRCGVAVDGRVVFLVGSAFAAKGGLFIVFRPCLPLKFYF